MAKLEGSAPASHIARSTAQTAIGHLVHAVHHPVHGAQHHAPEVHHPALGVHFLAETEAAPRQQAAIVMCQVAPRLDGARAALIDTGVLHQSGPILGGDKIAAEAGLGVPHDLGLPEEHPPLQDVLLRAGSLRDGTIGMIGHDHHAAVTTPELTSEAPIPTFKPVP